VIDWKTVAFQIVNFLVLLVLLKKLLYGRLIAAMDAREARIAASLDEAAQKQKDAEAKGAELQRRTDELAAQRDDLLAEAQAAAETARKKLVEQARADADRARAQWLEAVAREKEGFLQDLRQRASAQALAVARKALADLADAELEGRIAERFLAQIEHLDDADRQRLADAIAKTQDAEGRRHVLVRSAFDLNDDQRQRLGEAIGRHIEPDVRVDFATAGDVVGGLELSAGGTQLAWSLGHYLADLEDDLRTALEAEEGKAGEPRHGDTEATEKDTEKTEEGSLVEDKAGKTKETEQPDPPEKKEGTEENGGSDGE